MDVRVFAGVARMSVRSLCKFIAHALWDYSVREILCSLGGSCLVFLCGQLFKVFP